MAKSQTPRGMIGPHDETVSRIEIKAVERSLPGLGGALVVVLDEWVDKGVAPPRSNFPRRETGDLVTLVEYRELFPNIPGLTPPEVMAELDVLDFGPEFGPEGGRITVFPPRHGAAYQLFVPRPDGGRWVYTPRGYADKTREGAA